MQSAEDSKEHGVPSTQRKELKQRLVDRFNDIIGKWESFPLYKEFPETNTVIRKFTPNEGVGKGLDVVLISRDEYGVKPEQFVSVYTTILNILPITKSVARCDITSLEKEDDVTYETYACYIRSPVPLIAGRIMMNTKFYMPKDDMFIICSLENEQVREQYVENNPADCKGLAFADNILSAYKFLPIIQDGEVVGTKILNANQSDFGGLVPKWIVSSSVPQALYDFVQDFCKFVKEQK